MVAEIIAALVGVLVGAVVGFGVALFIAKSQAQTKVQAAERKSEADAERVRKELTGELEKARKELAGAESRAHSLERELKDSKRDVEKRENRIESREDALDKKEDLLTARETDVTSREKLLKRQEEDFKRREAELVSMGKEQERLTNDAKTVLERVSGMSQEEARRHLTDKLTDEVKLSAARQIKIIEEEAKEEAEKRAKRIIGIAIMRYAGEFANERTVSVVQLPSEEMKGRIIGREGRNIRAFEAATGIDVIIDDSPDAVILSGFNPVRREIARQTLEKLVADGRIHPARIEELVEKSTREVELKIKEAGEQALFELALGTMHPELIKLLGRMRYRTSYGQNVLNHSMEVGILAGLMASEMGGNVKEARRAGLLHDLGKAVDHEIEGPHAIVGANLARKFGESPEIVHAIAAHHEEEKPLTLLAHIVSAADAISGARPGARRESLENYLKRLSDLEEISNSFKGVDRSFAIQAGREVRIMVEHSRVDDAGASVLARDIAQKIEEKLTYPGQIKVCVIRETRAIEFAK